MGNSIVFLAVFVNYVIPIIIVVLVVIFIIKKFKYFDSKLDKILKMLEESKNK